MTTGFVQGCEIGNLMLPTRSAEGTVFNRTLHVFDFRSVQRLPDIIKLALKIYFGILLVCADYGACSVCLFDRNRLCNFLIKTPKMYQSSFFADSLIKKRKLYRATRTTQILQEVRIRNK